MPYYDRTLTSGGDQMDTRTIDHNDQYVPTTVTADIKTGELSRLTKGQNTPNFHARKKRGELLPLTRFFQKEVNVYGTVDTMSTYNPSGFYYNVNTGYLGDNFCYPQDQDIEDKFSISTDYFVQAAAAKIYSSGWDTLTFLSELHKTIDMIVSFKRNLINFLRKPNFEELWLSGRYGWKQIGYDIKDITQAINLIDSSRSRFRESVGTTIKEQHIIPLTYNYAGGSTEFACTEDWEIGLRGTVIADIKPPALRFNPIATAWEVIPLSFVVDWAINLGQYVEAMSFLAFSTAHYAAGGHHIKITRSLTEVSSDTITDWTASCSITNFHSEVRYTLRTPQTVSYTPLYQLRLDANKMIDLTSLLKQLTKGASQWRL